MLRKISAIATALVALSLVAGAATAQADPYEPNDSQMTAYGPLAGSTDYVGTIDTSNDQDWFVFYVRDHSQVTITARSDSHNSNSFSLSNSSGSSPASGCCGSWTHSITLERGAYYIQAFNGTVGSMYSLRIVSNVPLTNRNEIEARNNRDADIGEVNHYAGKVRSLTGLVHNSQVDVRRKTTVLRHAHGHSAINRARHNLAVAKRTLASRQRSLKSAQGSLRLWQTRLNIANQQVIQYG
jgi:hypothetical protein